jgi:transcriptional regulator GlxA family with amidase domain
MRSGISSGKNSFAPGTRRTPREPGNVRSSPVCPSDIEVFVASPPHHPSRRGEALQRRLDCRQRIGFENHTLRRLRDYVESRLADDLDVTQMAEVAGLSPAHFARGFTAIVGMTPFRYVMTQRLARARELIERTNRSALDIALDVGFKTPSHFTSRFRQEFGMTPRTIRQRTRGSVAPEER